MNKQEINDLLKVEAAYNKKGEFIGLALATSTNGQTGNVLVFNDAGFSGFKVGTQFVCGTDDEIRYEELELVGKRTPKNGTTGSLGSFYLKDALSKGRNVCIPSLDITIGGGK